MDWLPIIQDEGAGAPELRHPFGVMNSTNGG